MEIFIHFWILTIPETGGGGGDQITKHGTHISRDMGPGGGPYISNDMGLPGPMSLGKWGGAISLLHSSELPQVI